MPGRLLGSDGLEVRVNGEWAKDKLAFLDFYGPIALEATATKPRRIYIDLFAGPGVNVPRLGGEEFEGAALRALQMRSPVHPALTFTDAVFVNVSARHHAALQTRVDQLVKRGECLIPRARIHCKLADANECIPSILARYSTYDYFFVFADPEAPSQWPWSSVHALGALGYRSIDLYVLFPLEMALHRLFAYKQSERYRHKKVLSEFFGNDDWLDLASRVRTNSQSSQFRGAIEQLYLTRLRSLWEHTLSVAHVRRRGNHRLYRMLFASNHEAGKDIAKWAKRRAERRDQFDLGFEG